MRPSVALHPPTIGFRSMSAFRKALPHLGTSAAALATLLAASITLAADGAAAPLPTTVAPAIAPAPVITAPATPPLHLLADNGPARLPADAKGALPPPVVPELSQAELITRLERTIEDERAQIEKLRAEMQAPDNEFNLAEAAFKAVDRALAEAKYDAETLAEDGDDVGRAEVEAKIAELSKTWKLARERFDLAIETHKTMQQQVAALEEKLAQDQTALNKLKGIVPAPTTPPGEPTETAQSTSPGAAATPAPAPSTSSPAPSAAAVTPALPKLPATTSTPAIPLIAPEPKPAETAPAATQEAAKETPASSKPVSKELVKAKTEAHQKKEEAAAAEREVQSVASRIAALERNIALEQKLLVAAQKKSDIAFQTRAALDEDYDKRTADGASASELTAMREKLREADRFFARARTEVRERTLRLNELQEQLAELQREELAALNQARTKQREAQRAEEIVSELSNPYALRNLLQWLLDHGPKICLIVVSMLALRLVSVLSSQRFVTSIIERGARGTKQEREDRARTLMGVFRSAFSTTIIVGGMLMLFEEVGVAVAPLMGGAAVLGLAVAFGAQNLIRDYFYGFVILIENQYKLNDVLRIGSISGQVEKITLRMTVLRDLEGAVHFIPNGKIDTVTNLTHGWSRAVVDVRVSYRENVDQVMDELVHVGLELRKDPTFGPLVIDDPEMLGVDGLGESAVTVRMLLKTRPLQQWKVKRELLRRIKQRFDQLGWEIPFPQQRVQHRFETNMPGVETLSLDATPRLQQPTIKAA